MQPHQSLTASEVDQFANEGYLVRYGSLTPPMIVQLFEALDAVDEGLVEAAAAVASTTDHELWESHSAN